jgi:hypothetical protein
MATCRLSKSVCRECKKDVGSGEDGVCCDWCEGWVHRDCGDLTKTEYKALKNVKGSRWFCMGCGDVWGRLKELKEEVDDLSRANTRNYNDVKSNRVGVQEFKKDLEQIWLEVKGLKEMNEMKKDWIR